MGAAPKRINNPEMARAATLSIRAWQRGERRGLVCPVCQHDELQIVDKSARPHTAWFILICRACGLDEGLAITSSAHSLDRD